MADLLRGPFTVADYHRMADCGVLTAVSRVELVDGQVVQMTPIGHRHAACVTELCRLLYQALTGRAVIWPQNPVVLGERSEPQPDIAVLRPRSDKYRSSKPGPGDILLIIEVSDTTLDYDRDVKIPLYAAAGIPEAWLVDLDAGRIHVHRRPHAGVYTTLETASRAEELSILAFPHVNIRVDEVVGPQM